MAIKIKQENGSWASVYGTTNFQNNIPINLDTTLTKKKYAADAQAVGLAIGDLTDLQTTDQSNIVNAINELTSSVGMAGKIFLVYFDLNTNGTNFNKNNIKTAINENKMLVLGVTSNGLVLTFKDFGLYGNPSEVAAFENTTVDGKNIISEYFYVNNDYQFSKNTIKHTNPIDEITAEPGQIAQVVETYFDKTPKTWQAVDIGLAKNGITIIKASGDATFKTLEDVKEAIQVGRYVLLLKGDKYYPLLTVLEDKAVFYLSEITDTIATSTFIYLNNEGTLTTENFSFSTESNSIIAPETAAIGQALTVATITNDGKPVTWETKSFIPNPSSGNIGQTIAIDSIDDKGNISWKVVDFPEGGGGGPSYEIPSFDLIGTPIITEPIMMLAEENDNNNFLTVIPDQEASSIIMDTSNIMNALSLGPIKVNFQYIYNENTLNASSIINPLYFKEHNIYMTGLIDYVYNTPCFIFFTFEANKVTIYAETFIVDSTLTKENKPADAKTVGDWIALNSPRLLPTATKENELQYLTYDEEEGYVWKDLPNNNIEVDTTLTESGKAADAATVGSRFANLFPESSETTKYQYLIPTEDKSQLKWTAFPIATATNAGTVKAIAKTATMNSQVGIDSEGQLWAINSDARNQLPPYSEENVNQYVTPNAEGNLEWKILPKATDKILGMVQPDLRDPNTMTTPVGVDINGKLWTSAQIEVDKSLTQYDKAADAGATGAAIDAIVPTYNQDLNKYQYLIPDVNGKNLQWANFPLATAEFSGAVKAIAKTDDMNIQVGIDAEGHLWAKDTDIIPSNELPDYTEGDKDKYVTPDENGKLIWKELPIELPSYSATDKGKYVTPNKDGNLIWEAIPKGIPDYTAANQNQYITTNVEGNLEWKNLPEANIENAGIVILDTKLETAGHAADAKAVGDRLTALETKGSGSFFVIISDDKTCSHTFEQIATAIDNDFSIIAIYKNMYIPLTQYAVNELILFYITTIIEEELTGLFLSITPSETVNITIEKIQIATPEQAGLVKPAVKWSADMKSSVSIDTSGGLWFKTDKTLTNAEQAADAAAVRNEIERLENLIATLSTELGFIVTSDAEGNVTIVKMISWTVSNAESENAVISGNYWKVSEATSSDVVISSP